MAELRLHAGTQFDPEVVDAFLSSLEAFGDEQVEALVRREERLRIAAVRAARAHDTGAVPGK